MCVVGPQASPVRPQHFHLFAFGSTDLALRGPPSLPQQKQKLYRKESRHDRCRISQNECPPAWQADRALDGRSRKSRDRCTRRIVGPVSVWRPSGVGFKYPINSVVDLIAMVDLVTGDRHVACVLKLWVAERRGDGASLDCE